MLISSKLQEPLYYLLTEVEAKGNHDNLQLLGYDELSQSSPPYPFELFYYYILAVLLLILLIHFSYLC